MLETLSQGFKKFKNKLQGFEEITEDSVNEVLGDIRRSLLEADVALPVVKEFLARVKEKAMGEIVQVRVKYKDQKLKISPSDAFIKICYDELVSLMGPVDTSLRIRPHGPTIIMLVGLQGSGKTTTAGKIARFMQKQGKAPMLVAADIYRPAAVEQLKVIGKQIGIPVFSLENENPVRICKRAYDEATVSGKDVLILDTAGRLVIDEPLMRELADIQKAVQPDNILVVCDAMIGQDAVRMSSEFDQVLNVDGFIMTKLDGDTRGGSTLSVKVVTGKPVKFIGMGEGVERFEEFRPEGLASRIFGYGDIVGLVEDFKGAVDEKKAEEDAMRMLKGEFTLQDFMQQIKTLRKMGPLQDVMEKMPGMSDALQEGAEIDDSVFVTYESMISSMTPEERNRPQIINQSRARRIALGSGHKPHEVRNLVAQFMGMKKMMAQLGQSSGLLGKIPGLKKLDQISQMKKMMEGNSAGLEELFSGMKNPFKKKYSPEFSTKDLSDEERKKLKNKRKAAKKQRKAQKKKRKKK